MELIYGTTNPAKVAWMRASLVGFPLSIVGINEMPNPPLIQIDECGNDPVDNAMIKAKLYHLQLGRPVFSCDSGLYIENLPDDLQPGVHVRRVQGKLLNDAEMIKYYGGLAKKYGMLRARYRNAICLVDGENVHSAMTNAMAGEAFGIVAKPHPRYREGFPLDSLSVRLSDGKYFFDLPDAEQEEINPSPFALFLMSCVSKEAPAAGQ